LGALIQKLRRYTRLGLISWWSVVAWRDTFHSVPLNSSGPWVKVLPEKINIPDYFPCTLAVPPKNETHMPRGIRTEQSSLSSLVCAHSHRALRLPGVLVGDGRLGGISATISAYETLLLRGYDTDAVVLMDSGLGNGEAIERYLQGRVPVVVLPQLPSVEEVSIFRSVFVFFVFSLFGNIFNLFVH
jgi:hypothetical protein